MTLLENIDVDDLGQAETFYIAALGLEVRRRFEGMVELGGSSVAIFLLEKPAGSIANRGGQPRDYRRHWTPVHLDFVVEELDAALSRAVAAGAVLEDPVETHRWGRIAHLSDPCGHGICLVQFLNRGYDELDLP